MNPSDDKSAAPDGVVAREKMIGRIADWTMFYDVALSVEARNALLVMLAAAPHPAQALRSYKLSLRDVGVTPHGTPTSSDERLKGLRNEVLEEAAKACEKRRGDDPGSYTGITLEQGRKVADDEATGCAGDIRALKTEAAQKDQRAAPQDEVHEKQHVDSGPAEAAGGKLSMAEIIELGAREARAEHCLPAAREDGPSYADRKVAQEAIDAGMPEMTTQQWMQSARILGRAVLRWHEKTRKA